jgi:HAE1 family hydrophobic/amphiphilic exporter-1
MSFLARLSLANRNLVALATIAILLFGGLIIPSLKEELFPSITYPTLSVVTPYPGASPSIVEQDVTDPIEQSIQGIDGLQNITSYSNEGASVITVSFNYGTDLNQAQQTLSQSINRIQSSLPSGVTPQVQAFSIADLPIIQLAVTADEDQQTLASQLKHDTIPSLEQINGVGNVTVTGIHNQIVTVTLDLDELEADGLTVSQVQGALQANNISLPAGDVSSNGQTIPIKVGNTFNSLDDLKNIVVGVRTSQTSAGAGFAGAGAGFSRASTALASTSVPIPIKLSDVATVQESLSPSTSLTRTNGKPSLGISIVKTSDGNTVSISQAVHNQIPSLEKDLGHNAQILVVSDQAPIVTQSIQDLTREGLIGAGFAIVVILFFLFSVRSTLVTAISIPLSIVIALIGLYIGNYTLNLLTLGGLTIAVGRVVDDSIVVLENIFRHLQRGEEKRIAIPAAVREVARAVTASTLTTVAVFLPIAFAGGLVGELFSSFSVAVSVALLASLLVSLTIIPVLAYWFLKSPKPGRQQVYHEQETALERGYVALMRWVTGEWWQRTVLIIAAVVILIVSFSLSRGLQTNLFGSSGGNTYAVTLTLPPATSLDKADSVAKRVENVIANLPNVATYQVTVGSGGAFASLSGGGSNTATFSITANASADKTAFQNTLQSRVNAIKNLGGTLSVSAGNAGPSNATVQINVQASDSQVLSQAAQQVKNALSHISGLTNVTSNLTEATPEIDVRVDPQLALKYGMTAAQVAQGVRSIYSGSTVTKITLNGTEQDVDLFIGSPGTTVDQINNLLIQTPFGNVPVSSLATVEQTDGPTQITHINTNRTATISGTITDTNVGAVNANVQQQVNALKLPHRASVSFGGVSSDLSSTFRNLGLAVLAAIVLVYCIMVATFRSLLQPIILLVSIPFASTGSIILLLVTQIPLGAAALIGFLMLVGIVVTNAIVLLDLVRQYREKGMDARRAVIEGGKHRLRPILMTATATILALLPMALFGGSGGFISQPLAIVVIGGLTTSTILTLLLVPTLYVIVEGRSKRIDKQPTISMPQAHNVKPNYRSPVRPFSVPTLRPF